MKTLTWCLLKTQDVSILIFSPGNVAEAAMLPVSASWQEFH